MTFDQEKTNRARRKWNRNSRFYDIMTRMMETRKAVAWHRKLWSEVKGPKVLEVAVGTGRNFKFYPKGIEATGIDFSEGMLARAKKRAAGLGANINLRQMDVQKLDFPDGFFDEVVASCTFCSVPDPVLGLQEVRRVLKPGGKVYLLEHMRHDNAALGKIMDFVNPLVVRISGPSTNRRTLDNVRLAGLKIERVENMAFGGILRYIVATRDETAEAG